MRRTLLALCTACVAIMRSWMVSRTERAVATHQSRGVAESGWRARVETRWRWMRERKTSSELSGCGRPGVLAGLAVALAGMAGVESQAVPRAQARRDSTVSRSLHVSALETLPQLSLAQLEMRRSAG